MFDISKETTPRITTVAQRPGPGYIKHLTYMGVFLNHSLRSEAIFASAILDHTGDNGTFRFDFEA